MLLAVPKFCTSVNEEIQEIMLYSVTPQKRNKRSHPVKNFITSILALSLRLRIL